MNLFEQSLQCHHAMASLRTMRRRLKRFTFGRQWDDPVRDPDSGRIVTEHELLAKDGRPPLSNNLIRQLVKSVVGRYRQNLQADGENAVNREDATARRLADMRIIHRLDELDSRLLEEFLISGTAIQRVGADTASRAMALPLVMNVTIDDLFLTMPRDPRCDDIRLIGMIHRMTPQEVARRWGGNSRQRSMSLLDKARQLAGSNSVFDDNSPTDGTVTVAEVWRKEWYETLLVHDPVTATCRRVGARMEKSLRRDNQRREREGTAPLTWRWSIESRWVGRWFLPDGTLLTRNGITAANHPFVVKFYPLVDGEVHSLVEDVIDQQKYVNRLVNLIDRMMATSAKDALLFPVESLPEGGDFNDVARQWSATDGIVLYREGSSHSEPRQLNGGIADIGARDLLKVEMELFRDISGVGDVLGGRTIPAGMGAERYSLELQNATVAIRDLLDSFASLITNRNLRLLKGIKS